MLGYDVVDGKLILEPNGAELVRLLAAAGVAGDGHGLHDLALEGAEAAAGEQLRRVLCHEVYAQVGLVRAVFLQGLQVCLLYTSPPPGVG